MPFADNEGVRIHYEAEGSGPPLVLQHGMMMSMKRWATSGFIAALKSRYQVIRIDARGHGESDKPYDPAAYDRSSMASDVLTVMDELVIGQFHYWGYSMGGAIGFAIAEAAPDRLLTLIIGGMDAYERIMPTIDQPDESDPEAFLQAFLERLQIDPAKLPPAIRDEILANDFKAIAAARRDRPSIAHILPTLAMPCLLYAGDADPVHPKARKTAEQIPNAQFFSLPGLDHGAANRDSGLVLPHVMQFLERHA